MVYTFGRWEMVALIENFVDVPDANGGVFRCRSKEAMLTILTNIAGQQREKQNKQTKKTKSKDKTYKTNNDNH